MRPLVLAARRRRLPSKYRDRIGRASDEGRNGNSREADGARARAWRDVPDRHVCALARDAENTLQRSVCAEATTLVGVAVDSWKCHYQHHRLLRPQLSAT